MASGFLFKPRTFKEESVKCFKSLYLPYLFFMLLLYPYAIFKHNDIFSVMRIVEILTGALEHTSAVYSSLWFVIAIASMRIVMSVFSKVHPVVLAFSSILIYRLSISYFEMGGKDFFQLQTVLLCIPFFIFGKIVNSEKLLDKVHNLNWQSKIILFSSVLIFIVGFSVANGEVGTFANIVGHSLSLFYVNAIVLCFFIMYIFCFYIDIKSNVVTTISVGTLLILAFHKFLVGKAELFGLEGALFVFVYSVAVVLLFYLPIRMLLAYAPFLLGKGFQTKNEV